MTTVLAIESSCDETAVAVYDGRLRAHALHSQTALHAAYGGVVPELAARDHLMRITPLLEAALAEAGLRPRDIDVLAYTAGPGLAGALLVGAATAAGIATALGRPLIAVHHMEAHLLAPMLDDTTRADIARAFEEACVDVLVAKCRQALDQAGRDRLVVAGGVSANKRLRERLAKACAARGARLHLPPLAYCTDNAAMVAYTGWLRRDDAPVTSTDIRARWSLDSLQPPAAHG